MPDDVAVAAVRLSVGDDHPFPLFDHHAGQFVVVPQGATDVIGVRS